MTVGASKTGAAGAGAAGLVLMFEHGRRPDRAAIVEALECFPRASISFDPANADTSHHVAAELSQASRDTDWLELLLDGLTFDLRGLAPGPAMVAPEVAYRFSCDVDCLADAEAVSLRPGPHIAAGAHSLPVVRTLLALGGELAARLPDVRVVCWPPARTAIAPKFFTGTVEAWIAGGAFPALGMLGVYAGPDGHLRTEGLAFFIGCELALAPSLSQDRAAGTRLVVRIVQELVGYELPVEPLRFVIEGGAELEMVPDLAAGVIRIDPV